MMQRRRLAIIAAAALIPAGAAADEAGLIPDGLLESAAPAAAAPAAYTVFVEETLTLSGYRTDTPAEQNTLGHLFRLGLRGTWGLGDGLSFGLDAQATHQAGDDRPFDIGADLRLDIKEAFLAWHDGGWFAEAGRMTLKTGIASGFSPTDHFRSFALITTTTEDATQWREHRMGVVAVRGQRLWDGGGVSLAYAPGLAERADGGLWTDARFAGLRLHATNAGHRALLTLTHSPWHGVTPTLVVYIEDGRPHLGGSVSAGLGDSLILYGEADVGRRRSLLDETLGQGNDQWIAQATLGASWSLDAHVVASAEYHYNGAGLDGGDWTAWPDSGALSAVRALARDRQEPLSRHSLWHRVAWSEAFGDPDLTLTALAVVDARDASALMQAEAAYTLSGTTSLAMRGTVWLGDENGQYGSSSRAASLTVQVRHMF